jgi:hypothetical protein
MGGLLSSKVVEDNWKSDARYAMEAGTFCVVCGNPFDIGGDVYNIDPKDKRFQVRHVSEGLLWVTDPTHIIVVVQPSPSW